MTCEYCSEKKKIRLKGIDFISGFSEEYEGLHILNNTLTVEGDVGGNDGNYYFEFDYKINYCPMCGEKLAEE